MNDNGTSYFGVTYGSAVAILNAIVGILVAFNVIPSSSDPQVVAVLLLVNIVLGLAYHVQTVSARRAAKADPE